MIKKILHYFGIYSLKEQIGTVQYQIAVMRLGQDERAKIMADVRAVYDEADDGEGKEMLARAIEQHLAAEARLEDSILGLERQLARLRLRADSSRLMM